MKLINADALLKKTINNPLHVPYITKKDVIDMPSALNNQVNLCDSCTYTYPECPSEKDDVIFGNGIGNDNICACNKYQPTVQPVATDTNVGDTISRRAAIRWVKTECNPYGKPTLEFESGKKVIEHLEQMPPAQPEPQEGYWIEGGIYRDVIECNCSECGQLMTTAATVRMNFCPNCGAKMRGEQHETD